MRKVFAKLSAFFQNPYSDYLLLAGAVLLILATNIIWILMETRPPHWDMARHLWTSLQYVNLWETHKFYGLLANYYYYPPLLYLATLPFFVLFGTSVATAIASNSVFIGIAAFSMYGIGKNLWGRRVGLLASLFLLCSPMLVTQFKEFQIDAPLTAMVALSIFLLIKCREFDDRVYSLLLGVVIGLSMLTKWTYILIIALPVTVAAIMGLYQSLTQKNYWRRIQNMAAVIIAAYLTASIWYITNLHQLRLDLLQNGVGAGAREGDPIVGTLSSNVWYLKNLLNNQLYLVPMIILIIGIVFLFTKRGAIYKNRYPIALAVGCLFFFTFLRNKDARYTLPALVGVSILATYWIGMVRNVLYKNLLVGGVAAYLVANFYLISFGMNFLPSRLSLGVNGFPVTVLAQQGYIIGRPSGENWQLEGFFKQLAKLPTNQRTLYAAGQDSIWYNNWDLQYYATKYHVTLVGSDKNASLTLIRTNDKNQERLYADYKVLILPDHTKLLYKEHI